MNEPHNDDMLLRGDRVPNFTLSTADGRLLLFYEYAVARPTLIVACGTGWDEDRRTLFAAAACAAGQSHDAQVIVLSSPAVSQELGADLGVCVALDDPQARVRRRFFGDLVNSEDGVMVLLDQNLRVLDGWVATAAEIGGAVLRRGIDALFDRSASETLAGEEPPAGAAPILLVPRVLPVELCAELVAGFARWDPRPSPMPTADGAGLQVEPGRKSRIDAEIGDADLEQEVVASITRRVLPEVQKAFCYRPTRFERLKLVCYRADEGGHFAAHRDNTAPQTAHRRFALTLDLNRGDYRGGELVFPEYGTAAYAPSRGGAIVFSGSHAHAVQPVSQGTRYAVVSFMYHDERLGEAGQAGDRARAASPNG